MPSVTRGAMRARNKEAVRPRKPDYGLLLTMVALVVVGLQAVYSATFGLAVTEYNDVNYFVVRQGIWALIGGAGLIFSMNFRYTFWKKLSPVLMGLAVISLVLVLVSDGGVEQYGAQRWLRVGPLPAMQPSEFVKLAVIIYMSAWVSSQGDKIRTVSSGLWPFCMIVGLVCGLVMLEPDLGSATIIALIMGTLFFLGGASLSHIGLAGAAGLAGIAMLVMGAAYRSDRWQSFVDPWSDPAGTGFHIIQLLIALGSGGLLGLGVGASRQKYFYVPGVHTDGIFAVIGEEIGFIGAIAVIALFAVFVYRGIKIIQGAADKFGALMASGITFWIAYQALVNLGGITRSIPLTGIPLPFISYGGSALAANMFAVGILLNISRYVEQREPAIELEMSPAATAPLAGISQSGARGGS
ncbi:MAG: putative lipid II flippase FtsW [Dehalococcoidia bacterium]|nr:putative lipid II flippase FtsW [Dehalococcoidia bacterium]